MHELRHYLYDYIPPDKHLALVNESSRRALRLSPGSTAYFHEAMAISAQGIYRDALENGESGNEDEADKGYKHPYIPVLAGVAAPLVKAAVARNEHLIGGFSPGIVRRLSVAAEPPQ